MADKPSLCFKPVDIICLKLSLLTHFSSVKLSYWARLEMALHDSFILVALHNRDNQCKAPCKRTQYCWATTPNIVGCYMLRPFAHPVACCCVLLRAVAQSLKPVKPLSQQLPKFLLIRERRRWCNNVGSVCTALPTLVGPRTRIIHGLKVLWVVSFARCTAGPQHCWELMLRPFARRLILHEAIRLGQSCTEEIQNETHF